MSLPRARGREPSGRCRAGCVERTVSSHFDHAGAHKGPNLALPGVFLGAHGHIGEPCPQGREPFFFCCIAGFRILARTGGRKSGGACDALDMAAISRCRREWSAEAGASRFGRGSPRRALESANGMVRPCSCPASKLSWQGAPKTRSAPCLRHPIPRSP